MPIPGLGKPARPFSVGSQINQQTSDLLRKGQGGSGQSFDKIRQRHLWSTYSFNAATGGAISQGTTGGLLAAGDYPIFTTPLGQNGQGYPSGLTMSLRDTNLPGVQRVSDNQNFAIWEIGVSVLPHRPDVVTGTAAQMSFGDPMGDDVDLVMSNCVLGIVYLTNRVTLGLAGDFAPAGGPMITYQTQLASDGNQNVAGNGGGLQEGTGATALWNSRQLRAVRSGGAIGPAPALRRKLKVPIYLKSGDTFSFVYSFPRSVQLRPAAKGGTGGFALRLDWWAVESFREQG